MYLFNLYINTGIFPNILKTFNVIVIYIRNIIDFIIQIISQFSKNFEKLIKIRILYFLNINKILKTCQFGFRESTSTFDALLNLTSYLLTNYNKIERQSL